MFTDALSHASLPATITLFTLFWVKWRLKVCLWLQESPEGILLLTSSNVRKLVSQCKAYSPRLKDHNHLVGFLIQRSHNNLPICHLCCLDLIHRVCLIWCIAYTRAWVISQTFSSKKSLTSFNLEYYIKVLCCAITFDSFLAVLLFGKEEAQASGKQMKKGGSHIDEQKGGVDSHNWLVTILD